MDNSQLKQPQLIDQTRAKEIANNIDTFIFDCDGVLWDGHGVIEGSVETLLKLKELGKSVIYCTNNSSKSREYYADKCKRLGFPAEKEDIMCTSHMASAYLQKIKFTGTVYLIGNQESIGKELNRAGIDYIGTGPDPVEGTLEEWLRLMVNPEVNCVLVAMDPHFSYMKAMKAATYLKDPNCLFVATNEDPFLPTKGNIVIPGTGTMVVAVSHVARRRPEIVGKPSTRMFELLQDTHNLDPARCLMVGDSLNTDILFAKNCGMRSLMVLSGVNNLDDVGKNGSPVPDYYAPRLDELLKHI